MLKSDFHVHSKEDWYDNFIIKHSAKDIIRRAAKEKFEVMALTHHNHVFYSNGLKSFAKKKGVLLIPGAEATVEGCHVLHIGADNRHLAKVTDLASLERIKDEVVLIAAHPFFHLPICIGERFFEHHRNFHALEFTSFYTGSMMHWPLKAVNGNFRAAETAKKYGKALVGNSDCHRPYDFNITFSWLDAEKNRESVLEALRKRRVQVESRPMAAHRFARRLLSATVKEKWLRMRDPTIKRIVDISEEPFFKKFK